MGKGHKTRSTQISEGIEVFHVCATYKNSLFYFFLNTQHAEILEGNFLYYFQNDLFYTTATTMMTFKKLFESNNEG